MKSQRLLNLSLIWAFSVVLAVLSDRPNTKNSFRFWILWKVMSCYILFKENVLIISSGTFVGLSGELSMLLFLWADARLERDLNGRLAF